MKEKKKEIAQWKVLISDHARYSIAGLYEHFRSLEDIWVVNENDKKNSK